MKQLFCVVVTDPENVLSIEQPVLYHIECEKEEQAVKFALDDLCSEDYGYSAWDLNRLDFACHPITFTEL